MTIGVAARVIALTRLRRGRRRDRPHRFGRCARRIFVADIPCGGERRRGRSRSIAATTRHQRRRAVLQDAVWRGRPSRVQRTVRLVHTPHGRRGAAVLINPKCDFARCASASRYLRSCEFAEAWPAEPQHHCTRLRVPSLLAWIARSGPAQGIEGRSDLECERRRSSAVAKVREISAIVCGES